MEVTRRRFDWAAQRCLVVCVFLERNGGGHIAVDVCPCCSGTCRRRAESAWLWRSATGPSRGVEGRLPPIWWRIRDERTRRAARPAIGATCRLDPNNWRRGDSRTSFRQQGLYEVGLLFHHSIEIPS